MCVSSSWHCYMPVGGGASRAIKKRGTCFCCTHIQIVYVTDTAAPRNEGKHNREMKTVVI